MDYHWPGNVRELENVIERMVVMTESNTIGKEAVDRMLVNFPSEKKNEGESGREKGDLPFTVEAVERAKIIQALKKSGGIQAKAAKSLGITPRQIGYKIKKYRISSNFE
jgi:Nif-specific regulatory protein